MEPIEYHENFLIESLTPFFVLSAALLAFLCLGILFMRRPRTRNPRAVEEIALRDV